MEDFLGVPDVGLWLTVGLVFAATVTTFLGTVTGTAGGLLLLAGMTFFFPLAVLVPMHTMIQLGAGTSRMFMMWRYVKKNLILPFTIGSIIGAFAGAQIFTTLPSEILQGILGVFILVVLYTPKLGAGGPERLRFGILGGVATFLGIFVSATGTFLSPFIAHASRDRHIHVSTMATLMAISHVTKIIAFGFVGMAIGAYLPLIGLMILGTVAGNWIGQRTLTRMPEKLFRRVFQVLLTVLALRLLFGAALDAGWLKGII
ncbi:MAG: sulfite exporter TauE/SafE family protein [Pseudomonadota bacterium]|nr:sulfite exporter TauE/SafE family protein [Pseudomonadota bacterium]